MDQFIHVRMECLRLLMEGQSFPSPEEACHAAEVLVDYIKSGHVAGSRSTGRSNRQLTN